MSTKADIFIIESLSPDDEGNGRFEGQVISHVARLHGKQPAYHYVRTRDAFEKAIKTFLRSDFRYLHISAHADHEGLATTNQDEVGNRELGEMLGRRFADRRLAASTASTPVCNVSHGRSGFGISRPGWIEPVGNRKG
ncbi:MAG: hypothetical protein ABF739_08285 [Acetobacter okinawensis]|uniref:hypothetical protein n=1 Tax=Acetobacter okinawensis TaxID=1076594 RepID=UPI0039E90273